MSYTKGKIFDGHRYWSPYGSGIPANGLPDDSRFQSDAAFAAGAAAPIWVQRPSGVWVIEFDGGDYIDAAAADTTQMDIVSQDYTILCWFNWSSASISQHIMGRYVLDNNGWEIYLTEFDGAFHLTNRHHHAGTIVDLHPRTAYDSTGWLQDTIWFMAITRLGNEAHHYRNGVDLATTFSTGGLVDPEPCTQDLTIGIRYTKNAEWFLGTMSPPVVYNYALSQEAINKIYHSESYLE